MLDFGFSEVLLTSAIALVVLGPERLPKVARQVGNWLGRARLMARQLSDQLEREVNAEEILKIQSAPTNRAESAAPAAPVADATLPTSVPVQPPPLAPDRAPASVLPAQAAASEHPPQPPAAADPSHPRQ